MEKYAPVIIPTLCRYEKLKLLIQSLLKNSYAKDTELVVGLDYPPSEKYEEGHRLIREYLPSVTGFGKVTIIEHSENKGALRNEAFLIDYVYSLGYDRCIFTEDDNEFSPNFLEYMNKGLTKYRQCPEVFSISGYNYPIDMGNYDKNIWASYKFSAWGCGFWKEKRLTVTKKELVRFVLKPTHFFKILFNLPVKLFILPVMLSRHDIYGDSCYEVYSCVNNWVSIFPTLSKVRNWGRDGSGLHGQTDNDDPCYNQLIDTATTFDFDDIELKSMKNKEMDRYFTSVFFNAIKRNFNKLFRLKNGLRVK